MLGIVCACILGVILLAVVVFLAATAGAVVGTVFTYRQWAGTVQQHFTNMQNSVEQFAKQREAAIEVQVAQQNARIANEWLSIQKVQNNLKKVGST